MSVPDHPPTSLRRNPSKFYRFAGFSLVEVLAAVAIIGIITFLAIPNIVRIKEESERSLAISRAEALNLGMASFLQANGQTVAVTLWATAEDNQARYAIVAPFLAFAPSTVIAYMPAGFTATLPSTLLPLSKTALTDAANASISY